MIELEYHGKHFFSPFMFSVALAVTAFIIGCVKFTCLRKSWQSESMSSQCSVEPEDELASLLDNDVGLKTNSSEMTRLNEESEARITERITEDNERVINRITDRMIKQFTEDYEFVIKDLRDALKSRDKCES